jgi:hypothetical protein
LPNQPPLGIGKDIQEGRPLARVAGASGRIALASVRKSVRIVNQISAYRVFSGGLKLTGYSVASRFMRHCRLFGSKGDQRVDVGGTTGRDV